MHFKCTRKLVVPLTPVEPDHRGQSAGATGDPKAAWQKRLLRDVIQSYLNERTRRQCAAGRDYPIVASTWLSPRNLRRAPCVTGLWTSPIADTVSLTNGYVCATCTENPRPVSYGFRKSLVAAVPLHKSIFAAIMPFRVAELPGGCTGLSERFMELFISPRIDLRGNL